MRVLLVGSGAREHALGWALRRSPRVSELLSLPGNPGLRRLGPVVEGVSPEDVGAVAAVARVHAVDLVVIGPEGPLAGGLVDALTRLRIPAFGPTRAAARLESSKSFAKDVMQRAGVRTAPARTFEDADEAQAFLAGRPGPYVVKADGLAAGKGVLVTEDRAAAASWVDRCLSGGFGPAGSRVVIEEYLEGPELSVFALCDGESAVALEPARDYKRLADGDRGPNTGGMGSFSPVEVPDGLVDTVLEGIVGPVLRQMVADGHPYTGFLYVGLALTASGPQVIELNCRLGDPEAQVLVPRLESDLVEVIETCLAGSLSDLDLRWSEAAAVDVVLAAEGYPDTPRTGDAIRMPEDPTDGALVFHAGTARDERGRLVTSGGRVLSVVGTGPSVAAARDTAYRAVGEITWKGMRHRTDIGT